MSLDSVSKTNRCRAPRGEYGGLSINFSAFFGGRKASILAETGRISRPVTRGLRSILAWDHKKVQLFPPSPFPTIYPMSSTNPVFCRNLNGGSRSWFSYFDVEQRIAFVPHRENSKATFHSASDGVHLPLLYWLKNIDGRIDGLQKAVLLAFDESSTYKI